MIVRDWYGWGLAEQLGTGKLHHHIGLLAREGEGEELRGVYHFVKKCVLGFFLFFVIFWVVEQTLMTMLFGIV